MKTARIKFRDDSKQYSRTEGNLRQTRDFSYDGLSCYLLGSDYKVWERREIFGSSHQRFWIELRWRYSRDKSYLFIELLVSVTTYRQQYMLRELRNCLIAFKDWVNRLVLKVTILIVKEIQEYVGNNFLPLSSTISSSENNEM